MTQPTDRDALLPRIPGIGRHELDGPRLRAIRTEKLGLSQSQFARELQAACDALGYDMYPNKRLVQLWEKGAHKVPRAAYCKALELVTGESIHALCRPILPPDPDETVQQLAAIIKMHADLHHKITELYANLTRAPSPPRAPLHDDDLVRQTHAQHATGASAGTIAARLQISETTVIRYLDEIPLPPSNINR